jgi:DNA-binding MarR family transcriptional regulator
MPASPLPIPATTDCSTSTLRRASRKVAQLFDEALAPCGLRSTQYSVLIEIARHAGEPPTLQALADALVMDRSTLGHNLRPLERDELVAIVPGVADRRRRHIMLTPAGQRKLRAAYGHWQKAQARFHEVFGEAAAAKLRATLLDIAYEPRLSGLSADPD